MSGKLAVGHDDNHCALRSCVSVSGKAAVGHDNNHCALRSCGSVSAKLAGEHCDINRVLHGDVPRESMEAVLHKVSEDVYDLEIDIRVDIEDRVREAGVTEIK